MPYVDAALRQQQLLAENKLAAQQVAAQKRKGRGKAGITPVWSFQPPLCI